MPVIRLLVLFTVSILTASAANPFGVFDFDFRGANPAEKIHSIDACAFDGIAMWMNSPEDLEKFAAYQRAKPSTRLWGIGPGISRKPSDAIPGGRGCCRRNAP